MKLLELEIEKVRGIQHLLVKPNGKNFVIWGPNGSGKSALVDAIDFLLTGKIQRLTGEGTGNISLNRHGPHIDHEPKETMVRAVIELPSSGNTIELKRSIEKPSKLECSSGESEELTRIIALAEQGVHILTRREILKYITADANTRAKEIQELLDIAEIEETRKTLVKVKNERQRELERAEPALARAESQVNATTEQNDFDKTYVLKVINENRRILGAAPISNVCSANLKNEVRAPTVVSQSAGPNVTLFERDIRNLENTVSSEAVEQTKKSDERLRELIEKVCANPDLERTLKQVKLIRLGMEMIDETGNCPLCDTEWPEGKLLEYLRSRAETARFAGEYQREIGERVGEISDTTNRTIVSLQKVIAGGRVTEKKSDLAVLKSWLGDLEKFSLALGTPVESYLESEWTGAEIGRMLAPENVVDVLGSINKSIKEKYPETTPEQNAWDMLTRLEENLRAVENAEVDVKKTRLLVKRSALLHDHFLSARDRVLGQLYEAIRDRFVGLYRAIHADDENKFGAKIEPKEAGLNFEVDFYGRGAHPPQALHSEGHQDSMGLCLFLALAEHLTKGMIDLVVLDDVVMSVDAGHRRRLCNLFGECFPDRQFLITTHDKTWATQLKSEGVVQSKGSIEFYNWCLELGPQVSTEVELWKRIKQDLDKEDVPSASQKLRRGSEEFFGEVCHRLQARVKYKLDGRWELGDLLPAAMNQFRSLLKKAKVAAQSWGYRESFEKLEELDSTVGQVFRRCGAEQWAINANVHYSNWPNFLKNDFQPVMEAFEDLFKLFVCSTCAGMLYVTTKGLDLENVRCKCGSVNWNLIPQKGKL